MTRVPRYLEMPDEPLDLSGFGTRLAARHVFESDDVEAVNAALAAGRPLLVRGEPGAGKSQLARAAAVGLGRAFVASVIDARTEGRDLQWTFDAVRRLADAQLRGADPELWREREAQRYPEAEEDAEKDEAKDGAKDGAKDKALDDDLHELRYTEPGPLWWAFDWHGATRQARRSRAPVPVIPEGCSADQGTVVLLDEIDKADSSVPNALLGCLGDGQFPAPGGVTVSCGDIEPLVVVTTNEERSLPDAFLRRCLVHQMRLPRDEKKLTRWLVQRGRAHFGDRLDDETFDRAAGMLWKDRQAMLRADLAPPGGAEYLDLLRILVERAEGNAERQEELLKVVAGFALSKHPTEARD